MNALCASACFKSEAGRDRSRAIDVEDINAAREELILSRRTHLDQLAHKLEEERVRRVVQPILAGGEVEHDLRDLEYARDIGLLAPDSAAAHGEPHLRRGGAARTRLRAAGQPSTKTTAWYVDSRRRGGPAQAADGVRDVLRASTPSTGCGASRSTARRRRS